MIKILFVCMGNICRSPALAAVFDNLVKERGLSDKFYCDSCAVTHWFIGAPVDQRMARAGVKQGIVIEHTAQLLEEVFLTIFDCILATDAEVQELLLSQAPSPDARDKIKLATHFSAQFHDQPIEDPYYGGEAGFDHVMLMAKDVAKGILEHYNH